MAGSGWGECAGLTRAGLRVPRGWMGLAHDDETAVLYWLFPVEGVDQQDWSVEELPVTLGDDSDLAVDDGDGGLVVDGVAGHVERGGPALRVG